MNAEIVIDDPLIAAILAVGLQFKILSAADAIRWSDHEIEQRSDTPTWLIDLSLSKAEKRSEDDTISILRNLGTAADRTAICIAFYSLTPSLDQFTFDELRILSQQLYQITYIALRGDFGQPLLSEINWVNEAFGTMEYYTATEPDVGKMLIEFVAAKRDKTIAKRLSPLKYIFSADSLNDWQHVVWPI